jgi:hypothetical protein
MSAQRKRLWNLGGLLALVAAGLAWPGRASAVVVYSGSISSGSPSCTGQNICFTYNNGHTTRFFNNQYAGQLLMSYASLARVGDFFAYCVDLNHTFRVPTSWPVNVNTTGSVYGATVNNAGQIAYLIDHYGCQRLDADHSAGLQAAIWKEEYGNNFTLTFASSGVTSACNTYLGCVTGANSGHVATACWLDPTGKTTYGDDPQGLVAAAPEPASVVMLGGASVCFVGFYFLRRWFRPAAAMAQ